MSNRKYPPISIHDTLQGQLKVDWGLYYHREYNCPYCEIGKLAYKYYQKSHPCKLSLQCNSCRKTTSLTCKLPGVPVLKQFKHLPISQHQTLKGILKVDWHREYQGEYNCLKCNRKLSAHSQTISLCKLALYCSPCRQYQSLTCNVPAYIYNYRPDIECPNPICNDIGNNGQKGWIYQCANRQDEINCKCRFCGVRFNFNSIASRSWMGRQIHKNLPLFSFDDEIWNLEHFYDVTEYKTLNFQNINPNWYQYEVKKYLYCLLKSKKYDSSNTPRKILSNLKQLSKIIINSKIKSKKDINRKTIIQFLDNCKNNKNKTINSKLGRLRSFFDWLDLETFSLIRSRDFLKVSQNDPDWLDEVTRQAIKKHLNKIPAPIARHYLVQAYIATRPGDSCLLAFDCLIEEKGKWYVKFSQGKSKRWHRILASRKIRKVIEEQQQWIRKVIGKDYPYLFCHFINFRKTAYPTFSTIKPLPQPPDIEAAQNPMVRVIRMLIEKENILDANGRKPYFVGKITRPSRLQEVRTKYGMEAAQLYADHKNSRTTFQHYAPPTREQIAEVDLPFQKLLLNSDNKFLPWQSLPESLLKNPTAHELDLEIAPRLVVYGHCALNPKTPCPVNLFPKCYGCNSFRPSTSKLPLYERQYQGEQQRLTEAETAGAELASEEAKATITAMDKWLPELRRLADG